MSTTDPRLQVANTLTAHLSPPVSFTAGQCLTGIVGAQLLNRYYEGSQKTAEGQMRRAIYPVDPTVLEERYGRGFNIGWDLRKFESMVDDGYGFHLNNRGGVVELVTYLAGRTLSILSIYPDGRVTDTGVTHYVPTYYSGPLPPGYDKPAPAEPTKTIVESLPKAGQQLTLF